MGFVRSPQAQNIVAETESRWRLVETAWQTGVSANLLGLAYEESTGLIPAGGQENRLRDVTSARGALDGYQKGHCFYCYARIKMPRRQRRKRRPAMSITSCRTPSARHVARQPRWRVGPCPGLPRLQPRRRRQVLPHSGRDVLGTPAPQERVPHNEPPSVQGDNHRPDGREPQGALGFPVPRLRSCGGGALRAKWGTEQREEATF